MKSEYLGDGVYVSFDGLHICLHVDSHLNKPVVYLDPYIFENLITYVNKIREDETDHTDIQ